jgi:hypothetical protein
MVGPLTGKPVNDLAVVGRDTSQVNQIDRRPESGFFGKLTSGGSLYVLTVLNETFGKSPIARILVAKVWPAGMDKIDLQVDVG